MSGKVVDATVLPPPTQPESFVLEVTQERLSPDELIKIEIAVTKFCFNDGS